MVKSNQVCEVKAVNEAKSLSGAQLMLLKRWFSISLRAMTVEQRAYVAHYYYKHKSNTVTTIIQLQVLCTSIKNNNGELKLEWKRKRRATDCRHPVWAQAHSMYCLRARRNSSSSSSSTASCLWTIRMCYEDTRRPSQKVRRHRRR